MRSFVSMVGVEAYQTAHYWDVMLATPVLMGLGLPSRRASDSELPEMPVGTIVDVEPNTAMRVGPALEIIDDENWLRSGTDK